VARHAFTILCRSVATDTFSTGLTLVEIAESLGLGAPPSVSDKRQVIGLSFDWVLVTLVQRSVPDVHEEFNSRVAIVLPNGDVLPGPELKVDLMTGYSARNITKIPVLPYVGDGLYRFQFQAYVGSDWNTLGEFIVPVAVVAAENQSQE